MDGVFLQSGRGFLAFHVKTKSNSYSDQSKFLEVCSSWVSSRSGVWQKTRCFINESSNYKLGRLDNKFWTFTQRVYHFWIYMVKKTYWWHISLEPSPVWLVYPLCHGCFPLGPPSLGNHCKQWEWGITSRAKGQRCTNTHTNRSHWYFCIVESRTLQHMAMAPRFNRGLSVRHQHFWGYFGWFFQCSALWLM